MTDDISDRIRQNPRFQEVADRRNRLAWTLFAITMVMFFGLILTATFAPGALTRPITPGGSLSIGWPIGAAAVIVPWLLTLFYVHRANADSRSMTQIVNEVLA